MSGKRDIINCEKQYELIERSSGLFKIKKMALKLFYRGPSSRLETLIEKIQQNKDSTTGKTISFCFLYLKRNSVINTLNSASTFK